MLRDQHARRRLITFVALVGICVLMLAVSATAPVQELRRGVKFAIAPVQDTLSDGTRSVTSVLDAFSEVDRLRLENKDLRAAVDVLEDQLATLDALEAENRRLNKVLDTRSDLQFETIVAGVSSRFASQFERIITLDRGLESDIVDGAPVLSEGGALAGRVTDVGEGWAEVTLINDTSSLVAGRDNRTNATGNVVGRLAAPLAMEEIPRTDQVSINDRIVTLGASIGKRFRSVYPKGIPIGRVVDVLEEPGDVVKTALLQPDADLDHLEYVLVLRQGEFTPPRPIGDVDEEATEG
ncbi:MAG TPA: rod shape-determining protein MreC [Anaerolineae bacterium]|jgi:rod shape-determining protein MreC|nr:rod shape-determining protein MreC [Anaerolineae bacterium]